MLWSQTRDYSIIEHLCKIVSLDWDIISSFTPLEIPFAVTVQIIYYAVSQNNGNS